MTSNEKVPERRVAGVKAKHMLEKGGMDLYIEKNGKCQPLPVILVISTQKNRIIQILKPILTKSGKHLEMTGTELYRQSLNRRIGDLANRVVAIVITDQPDDYNAPGRGEKPLWQETIAVFQEDYTQSFAEDIGKNLVPENLTVITIFETQKGKLSDQKLKEIEKDFKTFQEKTNVKHVNCKSEEELPNLLDSEVVGMFLERHRQRQNVRRYERSRGQKIAHAQKVMKDVRRKMYSPE